MTERLGGRVKDEGGEGVRRRRGADNERKGDCMKECKKSACRE